MTELYTLENFTKYLNSHFEIHLEGKEPILLELTEAKEISTWQPKGSQRKPFSLLFHSPPEHPLLMQGLFSLSHPSLGKAELFLVPVDQQSTGAWYEAVFT